MEPGSRPSSPSPDDPRLIARIQGGASGPTLIVLGGIHGNEPAGVEAMRRVRSALERRPRRLAGELVLLSGNRQALAAGERYLVRDLNRGWSDERLAELERRAATGPLAAEDREQLELNREIAAAVSRAAGPLHFLDLHTTSAAGIPFLLGVDESAGRGLARAVPLPTILGLLERVEGTLLLHLARLGATVLGVEGGQNADPRAADHLEAAVWLVLVEAGLLAPPEAPEALAARELLVAARRGLPQATAVSYRHAIVPEDEFRMEPGFANLQRIRRGELLARDRRGEIRAEEDGLLLLPLYQARGEEGFFLGREVAL